MMSSSQGNPSSLIKLWEKFCFALFCLCFDVDIKGNVGKEERERSLQ